MQNKIGLIAIFSLSLTNTAHATDAGSITRTLTDKSTPPPATIAPLSPTQGAISGDTTPIAVSRVVLVGNTLLADSQLQPILTSLDGTTTTFGGLQQLAGDITTLYHKAGYPLASVIIPPQKIDGGVVQLQVLEGQITGVSVENRSRLSDKAVQGYLSGVQSGQPLRQADSERALLLIKDLAGADSVNYRLVGDTAGTTLSVELGDAPRMDGFVQVDNYGSKSTGEVRTRAGLNINSPFGRGEKLSVQAMSSFKGVNYARMGADVPLGTDGLTASVGVGHTRYDLGGAFKDLDATGTATTVEGGLRYPIKRSNDSNLWVNVNAEHRDLQDKVGATNTVTDKSLKAVQLGLSGYHQHSVGAGAYTQWGLTQTFGSLDIDTPDALATDSISARTNGNYHKINANINHTQYLTPKLSLMAGINGQWANKNLDSAEQMSLGGADSVSAYHSNDVSADMGVIGQVEARYAVLPSVSVSAFYDVGRAKLRAKPYTTQENFINLHGGGVGLYTHYKNLSLQGKVAWQGDNIKVSQDKNPKIWVVARYNF